MKFGQYELLERVAVGGMAEVYRGRVAGAEGFEKWVAIKRILPEFARDDRFISMMLTEARIHSALSHGNIVQIHDLGISEDGEYFIVLEYVEGHDLRAVMEAATELGVQIPDSLALHIAYELTQALHFAHTLTDPEGQPLGIIHRDVSPSNVLISNSGEVKLSDFGIAKRRHDHSFVGSLKGNLVYMSPEQARRVPLDRRTDVFSLGAVLFEMLTGQKLREVTNEVEGFREVASGVVRSARALRPDLSEAYEALLTRALAADPADRFPDAAAFGAAIRELGRGSDAPVGPADVKELVELLNPPRRARSPVERSKVIRLGPEFKALAGPARGQRAGGIAETSAGSGAGPAPGPVLAPGMAPSLAPSLAPGMVPAEAARSRSNGNGGPIWADGAARLAAATPPPISSLTVTPPPPVILAAAGATLDDLGGGAGSGARGVEGGVGVGGSGDIGGGGVGSSVGRQLAPPQTVEPAATRVTPSIAPVDTAAEAATTAAAEAAVAAAVANLVSGRDMQATPPPPTIDRGIGGATNEVTTPLATPRPLERAITRPLERPVERAAITRPLERPVERAAITRPLERPVERAVTRPIEQRPVARPIDQAIKRAMEHPLPRTEAPASEMAMSMPTPPPVPGAYSGLASGARGAALPQHAQQAPMTMMTPVAETPPVSAPVINRPFTSSFTAPTTAIIARDFRRGPWRSIALLLLVGLAVSAAVVHYKVMPLAVAAVWFKPASLFVSSDPGGASVTLDGRALPERTPTRIEVRRDRADHVLELTRSGSLPVRTTLRFDQTVELSQAITLPAAPPPPPPPPPPVEVKPVEPEAPPVAAKPTAAELKAEKKAEKKAAKMAEKIAAKAAKKAAKAKGGKQGNKKANKKAAKETKKKAKKKAAKAQKKTSGILDSQDL